MPESPFFHYNASFDAVETMKRHAVSDLRSDPAYLTNFLGVKIATRYFPGILDGREGEVEPIPIPANWHSDIAEWAYALRAVDKAKDTFRIIELGCGWGCWMNNTGAAARRRGLRVDLIGIEGDEGHVGFARESLAANGFAPDEFKVVHGVAAPNRAEALFPIVANSGATWGSEPIFEATPEQISKAKRSSNYQVLDTYPLSDLSHGRPIDLLHIDIQGGETDFVKANFADIDQYVRRMLIGTHSRIIEGDILRFMIDRGWRLEIERPCIFGLVDGRPQIQVDGVQGWVNGKEKQQGWLSKLLRR
ncbi:MAG: class I SAM-dependent methyltransferase [Xanthobacteraceae bacterium]